MQHKQWRDPLAIDPAGREQARALVTEGPPPVPPAPPRIAVEWHDGAIRVSYRLFPSPADRWPDALVVTVNSPDEAEPPTTEQFAVEAHDGTLDLTTHVDPAHRYDVHVSAASRKAELASESVRVDLPPEAG
jgi:hypothetical protein